MPVPAAVLTCVATCWLMRSSFWIWEMNAPVRPARTIAPMSATPSDEPSCCPVYCRPPASPRPDASTDDCTTLPSCDAMSPIPTPSKAIETAKPASLSCGSIVATSTSAAPNVSHNPARTIVRIGKRFDSREPNAEAMNIAIETGSILMPVSSASSPSTSCRYSGMTKNTPMRMRFWLNSP